MTIVKIIIYIFILCKLLIITYYFYNFLATIYTNTQVNQYNTQNMFHIFTGIIKIINIILEFNMYCFILWYIYFQLIICLKNFNYYFNNKLLNYQFFFFLIININKYL